MQQDETLTYRSSCLAALPSYCFSEYKTLVTGGAFSIKYLCTKFRNYESVADTNVQ